MDVSIAPREIPRRSSMFAFTTTLWRKALATALALSLVVMSVLWVLYAAPAMANSRPRAKKVQYGCRNKLTGAVRQIARPAAKCHFNGVRVLLLSSSGTGSPTLAGPQGADGAQGSAGADGVAG